RTRNRYLRRELRITKSRKTARYRRKDEQEDDARPTLERRLADHRKYPGPDDSSDAEHRQIECAEAAPKGNDGLFAGLSGNDPFVGKAGGRVGLYLSDRFLSEYVCSHSRVSIFADRRQSACVFFFVFYEGCREIVISANSDGKWLSMQEA